MSEWRNTCSLFVNHDIKVLTLFYQRHPRQTWCPGGSRHRDRLSGGALRANAPFTHRLGEQHPSQRTCTWSARAPRKPPVSSLPGGGQRKWWSQRRWEICCKYLGFCFLLWRWVEMVKTSRKRKMNRGKAFEANKMYVDEIIFTKKFSMPYLFINFVCFSV